MKRATLADFADAEPESGEDDQPATTFAVGRDEPCAQCGSRTDRQWRTDAGYVCPTCVEW